MTNSKNHTRQTRTTMKTIITSLLAMLLAFPVLATEDPKCEEGDTNKIRINKTLIIIINERENDTILQETDVDTLTFKDIKDEDDDEKKDYSFDHWSGIYLGVNMFMNEDISLAPVKGYEYLEQNPFSSIHWQFYPFQKDIKLAGEYLKFVTGLGIDFRRFSFKQDYTLQPGTNTVIAVPDSADFRRNRLNTFGFRVPTLVGVNFGKKKNTVHATFGAVWEYKGTVSLHQKYFVNGEKHVVDFNNPYNVNRWNVSAVAGLGIGDLYFYGEYQINNFFEQNLNPAVKPVTVGLRIINF
jgi:uncharacterized lipoprotein YehR (DUF1307 family)